MKGFTTILLSSWIITHSQGQPRIMNGNPADVGQFPYQAYITDDSVACGASIIHKRWLLTAAHCRLYLTNAYAIVGTVYKTGLNGTRAKFEKFIQHNNFDKQRNKMRVLSDIALIRLNEDLQFTKYVKPIKLARGRRNDYADVSAMLSGWGIQGPDKRWAPDKLQYASLEVIGEKECAKRWRMTIKNQICTAGSVYQPNTASACVGDSGGPLVYKNRQIGVVSYGQGRCGVYLPDVYTRVSSYVPWIQRQLQSHSDKLS